MFNVESKPKPPAQRVLSAVMNHRRWLDALDAAHSTDDTSPHPAVRHRAASHFVAASQPCAGTWLDIAPDGSHTTRIASPAFEVMMQRRGALPIALAATAFDVLEQAGERVDRLADGLANSGEYNRRHNAACRGLHSAISAVAVGPVLLGDKERPEATAHLNSDHVLDVAEVGGDIETGGDHLWEIKTPSPTTTTRSEGRGSSVNGGAPASVGHHFAFGNTEEKYRVNILGCRARGRQADGPFNHSTGKGWVAERRGDYHDALIHKRSKVTPFIVETTGGIAPESRAALRRLARRAKAKGARDRSSYGSTRISPRSFLTHHTQQIVKGVVMYDALNIMQQIGCAKQRAHDAA